MKWNPLGDSARITKCDHAAAVAQSLRTNAPKECLDVISSYRHLAVYFSPQDAEDIHSWLEEVEIEVDTTSSQHHQLPVWYDPEWLSDLSHKLSLSPEDIIGLHTSTTYRVAALGFSPGFPYLTGLPPELQLPRKSTPARLPAGTVAIAADQAGVYPNDSFGGWHPLGLTTVNLFNPEQNPPSLLEPGNEITFNPIFEKPSFPEAELAKIPIELPALEILSSGPTTSIQSTGRLGHRHLGVTPGGSADPEMIAALNLLLRNTADAPVIEFALEAPVLRFLQHTEIAFLGPQHKQAGCVMKVKAGTVLDLRKCGPMQSAFGALAISGGFKVLKTLGSSATDLRAGFGGKVLNIGDFLIASANPAPEKSLSSASIRWPLLSQDHLIIRILPGEQATWFSENIEEIDFQKSARFDRTAARLQGSPLIQTITEELTSRPIIAGAIQVPPDGIPTVLLPECQTIGGYPVIAHVISADLPAFTRAKPGTRIHFQKVTLEEARRAFEIQQRELAFLRCGLNFST